MCQSGFRVIPTIVMLFGEEREEWTRAAMPGVNDIDSVSCRGHKVENKPFIQCFSCNDLHHTAENEKHWKYHGILTELGSWFCLVRLWGL